MKAQALLRLFFLSLSFLLLGSLSLIQLVHSSGLLLTVEETKPNVPYRLGWLLRWKRSQNG